MRSVLARIVSGAGRLLNSSHAFGRREAVAVQPPGRQPPRMRKRDRQVVESDSRILVAGRTGRQRQLVTLTTDPPQQRVDERARALLAGLSGHVDRIADDSRRGNAIQMEKLEHRAAQDIEHLRIQPRGGAAAERGDDVVERSLPPERAGDDLTRERAIAFVRQARARAGEGMGQVGSIASTRLAGPDRRPRGRARSCSLDLRSWRDVTPGQEFARGHRALALWLNREHAEDTAVARDDFQPIGFRAHNRAGRIGTDGRREGGPMNEAPATGEPPGHERPRLEPSNQVVKTFGRQRPVDRSLCLCDLRRVGGQRRVLWGLGRSSLSNLLKHLEEEPSAELREVSFDVDAGFIRIDGTSCHLERRAGVELLDHPA